MGAVLLCGGTKGKRYALPNANIMIHQLLGGAEGPASDVEIRVRYMLKLKQRLNAHHRQAHRPLDRAGGEGLRPRQLHDARRSQGLRTGGRSGAIPQRDSRPGRTRDQPGRQEGVARDGTARPTSRSAVSAASPTPRSRSSLPAPAFTSATTASCSASRSSTRNWPRRPRRQKAPRQRPQTRRDQARSSTWLASGRITPRRPWPSRSITITSAFSRNRRPAPPTGRGTGERRGPARARSRSKRATSS